jgi:hypothetical protein
VTKLNTIKDIIDAWDPIGLLPYAPSDEYNPEIEEIEKLFQTTTDVEELGNGIYSTFIKWFDEDCFCKSRNECMDIAQQIVTTILHNR